MTTLNTTSIYPPHILPARPGVYLANKNESQVDNTFAYFDGSNWGCGHDTVDAAWRHPDYEFADQEKFWRGLASEVKAC